MAERLLAPKDVAAILGVGYSKAALLMERYMNRIDISTKPNSPKPRYVVTESELNRWQKEQAKAPALILVSVPKRRAKTSSNIDDFSKYRNPDGTIKRRREA